MERLIAEVPRREAPRPARPGPPAPLLAGWAALALAAIVLAWAAAPLARPAGPDLAALRPLGEGADHGVGAGGSTGESPGEIRGAPPGPHSRKVAPAAPLDLNRATAAELATLPGIGPGLAARIVAHREAVGPFPRLGALRGVPGIGPTRYQRLVPLLRVSAASPTGGEDGGRPPAGGGPEGGGDEP